MRWLRLAGAFALSALTACSDVVVPDARDVVLDASDVDVTLDIHDTGALVDIADSTDADASTCHPTMCGRHFLECGDCIDNDGDGRVDSHDEGCTGPCDNAEQFDFYFAVGGWGKPCTQDCFFDAGEAYQDDTCRWDHRCDPREVAPDYTPEGSSCAFDPALVGAAVCPSAQSTMCLDTCLPLTPNGCDCFGCCTFPELATAGPDGGPGYVWIGSRDATGTQSCTRDRVSDQAWCHACTPVATCLNDCGPCEVCIGRAMPSSECEAASDASVAAMRCASGVRPCGLAAEDECPAGTYCITGCCQPAPM